MLSVGETEPLVRYVEYASASMSASCVQPVGGVVQDGPVVQMP